MIKGITPKIRMLCFVLIYSVLLKLLRVWTSLFVRYCLASTETVKSVRDKKPRTATSTFTQLLSSSDVRLVGQYHERHHRQVSTSLTISDYWEPTKGLNHKSLTLILTPYHISHGRRMLVLGNPRCVHTFERVLVSQYKDCLILFPCVVVIIMYRPIREVTSVTRLGLCKLCCCHNTLTPARTLKY